MHFFSYLPLHKSSNENIRQKDQVRLLRQQKGWTQQEVAIKLDVSIPAFSKMETGITDLNLSRLNQIAKIFDLPLLQLVSNSDTDDVKDYNSEISILNKKIQQKDDEVIQLRKKIIELYEQIEKDNKRL